MASDNRVRKVKKRRWTMKKHGKNLATTYINAVRKRR
jgi:hypothetical protein